MTNALPFQTRARTIDHLGREQIADVPTAVSELWKNAYDAYASNVALHIYDDKPPVATILDNGHGMSYEQFVEKWLVVGTESKATNQVIGESFRKGLAERPKQGQKGIGRLSVAALGSTVLVVTKQEGEPLVACLIDWRLFENPYLFLHDIRVPIVKFESLASLPAKYEEMASQLLDNITGSSGPADRTLRITAAWNTFDQLEASGQVEISTSKAIRFTCSQNQEVFRYISEWSVSQDESSSGTAMILLGINSSLKAWLPQHGGLNEDEKSAIKASLIRTLSGFSDPYINDDNDHLIDYKVVVHSGGDDNTVVRSEEDYGLEFLRSLEHSIEGGFDEFGVFRGNINAFGKNFGEVEIIPSSPPPTAPRDRVGAFKICIGAFEGDASSSTHSNDVYATINERGDTHGGLYLYRDGLRVMPYGRPENDFFKIEERRTSKAGREFWSSRKLFGRIAITRNQNGNLRDKAGREGLIDNAASRAMQVLVIDLLKTTARRYFGGESPIRKELLPTIQAENSILAKKAKAAGTSQLRIFKNEVSRCMNSVDDAISDLKHVEASLANALADSDADALWRLRGQIDNLIQLKSNLQLPPRPKNLGRFENTYRQYRDLYSDFVERTNAARSTWSICTEKLQAKPPIDVIKSSFGSNQKSLNDRLGKWQKSITDILRSEISRIEEKIDSDRKEYYKAGAPLIDDVQAQRTPLTVALTELEEIREDFDDRFRDAYEPYYRSVLQLSEGIDLDGAFGYAGNRNETLEKKVEQIQGLAQIGISVEILSHELETLDRRLNAGLLSLPVTVRSTKEYQQIDSARRELVERLRFLSQMQISAGDIKQEISGEDIGGYLKSFFDTILENRGVELKISTDFSSAKFHEFPSRIYPVFINLINNSIYWLAKEKVKKIFLDARMGELLISDTGPGISQDDVPSLFELFFTRRVRGRGVGLYLCRQTLATGGHEIRYATKVEEKILSGANFIIKLRDGFHV